MTKRHPPQLSSDWLFFQSRLTAVPSKRRFVKDQWAVVWILKTFSWPGGWNHKSVPPKQHLLTGYFIGSLYKCSASVADVAVSFAPVPNRHLHFYGRRTITARQENNHMLCDAPEAKGAASLTWIHHCRPSLHLISTRLNVKWLLSCIQMCAVLLIWIQITNILQGKLCRFYALESGFAASAVRRACIAVWLNLLDTPAAKLICVTWDWKRLWLITGCYFEATLSVVCLFGFFFFFFFLNLSPISKTAFSLTTVSLLWPFRGVPRLVVCDAAVHIISLCKTSFHCAIYISYKWVGRADPSACAVLQEIWLIFNTVLG